MKKYLKYIDGSSNKFWQIEVTGSEYTVKYGKNGTAGTSQAKSFSSNEECMMMAEKMLAEKVKKGYSESGDVTVASKPKTAKSSNSKEIIEEYDNIIQSKNVDLLLPFLKEKSKGNSETLTKHIKKCKRYWMTYTDLSKDPGYVKKGKHDYGWGNRGDTTQSDIITLSAIALFDKTDINSWDEALILLNEINEKSQVLEILVWAKPNWLETFILDKIKRQEWVSFGYHNLRKLEDLHLVHFNPELFALCLAENNEWRSKIATKDFIIQILNDKVTYQRDVPELFNYETNLHNNLFTHEESDDQNDISAWEVLYKSLLEEKKMDRAFFIENAIHIQNREWNNNLKSFFRKRIEEFNVTPDELIPHQETVFSFLHNPYPPITTYAIELIKKIYDHPKFKTKSFLEWLQPLMMRSDCKASIKTVLPVLEKLSKSNPKLNMAIANVIADVYVISDLTLQEKVSKFLLKIATQKDTAVKEKLSSYSSLMQGNIKSVLSQFIDEDALAVNSVALQNYKFQPKKELVLTDEVQLPKDWNAILFQFGKLINSEEALDAEVLMNVYITQRDLFPSDYTLQLQPYFKQLQKQYFESVHKSYMQSFLIDKIVNIDSKLVIKNNIYSKINTTRTIQPLLEKVQEKINSKSVLPLLSFPTHKPYWIAPKVLLQRIIAYQKANEEIDYVDLAVAIARMPRENTEEAIPLLDKIDGEIKQILSFCLGVPDKLVLDSQSLSSKLITTFGKTTKETGKLSLWAVAARTFYPNDTFPEFENTYLKDVPFVVSPFYLTFNEWNEWTNYHTNKEEKSPLSYTIPNYLLYSLDTYNRSSRWDYALSSAGNSMYWHSLMPQNNDPLALTLLQNCGTPDGSKPELKGFLQIINRPEFKFSECTLFLFAFCFFMEKKDIRLFASEVLIHSIERQAVNMKKFAPKLAYLTAEKYGTLSGLVDGLIAIKDISPLHNSALLQLLNSFFENLKVKYKLPTNFKKIIEIYVDILTKTNQQPSEKAIVFFEQWKDSPALKSLIKQILK